MTHQGRAGQREVAACGCGGNKKTAVDMKDGG